MANKYWNDSGKYQKEYEVLFDVLVPETGRALTVEGELLRCISRLYYDNFNNGRNYNEESLQKEILFLRRHGYVKARIINDDYLRVVSGVTDRNIDKIIERIIDAKGIYTELAILNE